MGLLRSEAMKQGLLVLPHGEGQARKYLNVIGQETSMQFEDMNADVMRRPYRRHVQRIEEMERILRFIFEEMNRMDCPIKRTQVDTFLEADASTPYNMDETEKKLKKLYVHWTEMMANDTKLRTERNHVAEEVEVLQLANKMMTSGQQMPGDSFAEASKKPLLRMLNSIAGVILAEDQQRFSRAVFRASRGNTFTYFAPIEKKMTCPKTGNFVNKNIFVIFFQGSSDQQSALKEKISKVCNTFGVNTYAWPHSATEAAGMLSELEGQLREKTQLLENFEDYIRTEAKELINVPEKGRSSTIEEWRMFCAKEKSIYAVLNMFEGHMHLRAKVWFAESEEDKILEVLAKAKGKGDEHAVLKVISDHNEEPPTYIRTNEFTDVWQCVISTYGVPRYQEANPALFAVVTFPFIFGMMYGDVGHGTCLMLFGFWLCNKGKALLDMDNGETLYWVRYLVLQLGIYATFAGFLYNDMFSIGLQLFPSRYAQTDDGNLVPTWDFKNEGNGKGGPYPFGVDWMWHGAGNELMFMNSMKMKLAVLFGVLQMLMGVFLRFGNAIFFRSKIDFFFECVPMLIFMVCFFGWMDFMIVYKWVNPLDAPPGIINSLICMAMGPMGVGQTDEYPLWPASEGGMSSVQLSTHLMNLAVLSVPWLLIFKPFLLKNEHAKAQAAKGAQLLSVAPEDVVESGAHGGHGHGHGEEFEFGEVLIHQVIETIEYVLGTVSHTASYLRIWALSLAHQQLSDVFFTKTIGMALPTAAPMNGIFIYLAVCVWFGITAAVLLGMDVLECFLHTLRLHWVEFDSKFYKADGYAFEPYSVKGAIAATTA